jgi:hypothetical protein
VFHSEEARLAPHRLLFAALLLAGCARGEFLEDLDGSAPGRDAGRGRDGGPGGDAPCSALDATSCDPDSGRSLYVSAAGSDSNTGLTPDKPLRTLSRAIQQASDCPQAPCNLRIAEGTYTESIAILHGVHLFGGYSADFSRRDPETYAVTLTSSASHTVNADGLRVPTVLDGLTISGAILDDSSRGASSYALWVSDSAAMLALTRVTLRAGAGATGSAGGDGQIVACDAAGGPGGAATDCASEPGGSGTAGGDPVLGGMGGGGGDNNCVDACPSINRDAISDGEPGQPGESGAPGSGGVAASELPGMVDRGVWRGPPGSDGTRGQHGTGGGGGGAGGTKRIRACFDCGTLLGGHGGAGARGGCGGGGGRAGGPGGGAFALFVIDSTVSLEEVTLLGGQGGAGGPGGRGADGAAAGPLDSSARTEGHTARCGAIDYGSGHGAPGGAGGAGGAGGGGAGGLGGAAITLVTAGTGAVTRVGAVTLSPGEPGPGGPGGGSSGAAGASGPPGFVALEHAF